MLEMVGVVIIFMVRGDGNLDRSDSSIVRISSFIDWSSDSDVCDGVVVGDEVGNDWIELKVMLEMIVCSGVGVMLLRWWLFLLC